MHANEVIAHHPLVCCCIVRAIDGIVQRCTTEAKILWWKDMTSNLPSCGGWMTTTSGADGHQWAIIGTSRQRRQQRIRCHCQMVHSCHPRLPRCVCSWLCPVNRRPPCQGTHCGGRGGRCQEGGGAGATSTMQGIDPVVRRHCLRLRSWLCAVSTSVVLTGFQATPADRRLSRQCNWCPTVAQR